jgi:hypothetical protein
VDDRRDVYILDNGSRPFEERTAAAARHCRGTT